MLVPQFQIPPRIESEIRFPLVGLSQYLEIHDLCERNERTNESLHLTKHMLNFSANKSTVPYTVYTSMLSNTIATGHM